LPLFEVQHHHAHIAAVMADCAHPRDGGAVLGIALDGLGMGNDETLWGGEFLIADYGRFERIAHLPGVPLPGATQALLEPWRNTWAQLATQIGWERVTARWGQLEPVHWLSDQPVDLLTTMLERQLNSPLSSSCGRLFDAVAGLLGICRDRIAYEGQAAIELEVVARQAPGESLAYPIDLTTKAPTLEPLWTAMLEDLERGTETARIAARFHRGLGEAIIAAGCYWAERHDLSTVGLSGGVLQNRSLFEQVDGGLRQRGLTVLSHHQVPSNDGCIALGQALIGAETLLSR
jgi:hydrogenase maturation protein HypF